MPDEVLPEARAAGWVGDKPPPRQELHSKYVEPLDESTSLEDFIDPETGELKPLREK